MKKTTILVTVLFCGMASLAQKTDPSDSLTLKNESDSISYVLGEVAAFYLVQQGLGEIAINKEPFARAVTDILAKRPAMINDVTANALLNNYMMKQQAQKAKKNIDDGTAFLAQNKNKAGVKTTASGLQYEIITEGKGIKPTLVDTFVVNYRGTLLNGFEFDASSKRGQPLIMGVNQVIKGWSEGLQLMGVGSKYKFYIPYSLGYGMMDNGAIPGGSILIFEVELLDVKKKK